MDEPGYSFSSWMGTLWLFNMCYHSSHLQFDSILQAIFFLFSEQCSILRSGLPWLREHYSPSPGRCGIAARLLLDLLCPWYSRGSIEASLEALLFSPSWISYFRVSVTTVSDTEGGGFILAHGFWGFWSLITRIEWPRSLTHGQRNYVSEAPYITVDLESVSSEPGTRL